MSRHFFENHMLRRNTLMIWEYLTSVVDDEHLANSLAMQLEAFPAESLKIINSIYENAFEKERLFLNLFFSESQSVISLGSRGSGKTTFNKWLIKQARRRGYAVFYRNPDFVVPSDWVELSYDKNFPYREVYEFVLSRKIGSSERFEDVLVEIRESYAKGLLRGKKVFIVHDEVSSDVDSKVFNSPDMRYLRSFLRELRKLGVCPVVIWTDVLATNICIDFIRMVCVKIFKKISSSSLMWDRPYFEEITPFLPSNVFDTLISMESFDSYFFFKDHKINL